MKKVFCIGELLIDFVAENQGKDLSKAKEFSKKAGGAPANVACAISKLGGDSFFVGAVGNDPFGSFLLRILENEKVDINPDNLLYCKKIIYPTKEEAKNHNKYLKSKFNKNFFS